MATVDALDLFECHVLLGLLDFHRLVVAWLLLSVRVIVGVSQQVCGRDRVPDANRLI